MSDADDSAFPTDQRRLQCDQPSIGGGLTKREWFAGLAMQGLLVANEDHSYRLTDCTVRTQGEGLVESAVWYADALLAELAKEPAP